MHALAAIGTGTGWQEALAATMAQITLPQAGVDLALLFASHHFEPADYALLARDAQMLTGARVLIGCSGQGVIGPEREIEREPAVSLSLFSLPGATLQALHLTQADLDDDAGWLQDETIAPERINAWLCFADPFTFDTDRLLQIFTSSYAGKPLVGGLSAGNPRRQESFLFLNGEVLPEGALALAIGGDYTLRSVVSQGCAPIGEAWTITSAEGNIIEQIGMRPAVDVLMDTYNALPPDMQERASRNLLVGLAMDEYKDEHVRGDFLIRNIMGIDRDSGVIAIGALPRVGQTVQFQLRDPDAATEDLQHMLAQAKQELEGEEPAGALLCCCNGRGIGLFGAPDHDVKIVKEHLGSLPIAGFFCNGEIGPVGGKNFLHGFTASMALFVKADPPGTRP